MKIATADGASRSGDRIRSSEKRSARRRRYLLRGMAGDVTATRPSTRRPDRQLREAAPLKAAGEGWNPRPPAAMLARLAAWAPYAVASASIAAASTSMAR